MHPVNCTTIRRNCDEVLIMELIGEDSGSRGEKEELRKNSLSIES